MTGRTAASKDHFHFSISLPVPGCRNFFRNTQDNTHLYQLQSQRRTAVTEERQRNTGSRQQTGNNSNVQEGLQADLGHYAHRQQRAESVTGMKGDPKATQDQEHEHQNDNACTDQAQLFAHNSENKVIVLFRQEQKLLPALTESGKISAMIQEVSRLGLTVRGVFGEGSQAEGHIYQISNEVTLGVSEQEILNSVEQTVLEICQAEHDQMKKLYRHFSM